MTPGAFAAALAGLALGAAAAPTAAAHSAGAPEEEAYPSALLYELPAAGSYELPPIDRVQEHRLLDSEGGRSPLPGLAPGQCALVAFVYLSCSDATGCPLALASLQRVDRELAHRPDVADRVRLVTVSFDARRDTPPKMAELRGHMRPRSDWRFLTAASPEELAPVLADYGQGVVPLVDAEGAPLGLLRHVVKVFLVDDERRVRNVYSSGFLDARLVIRDVETLLLERGPSAAP